MVYEPDRFLGVAVTVLIVMIAMALLCVVFFFVIVGIVWVCERMAKMIATALHRANKPTRGRA